MITKEKFLQISWFLTRHPCNRYIAHGVYLLEHSSITRISSIFSLVVIR